MRPPRIGFVMEHGLGHVTLAKNLQQAFARDARLSPVWMPVAFADNGPLDRIPGINRNWTVRGSLRGYAALRRHGGAGAFDAVLIHTQTIALAAPWLARSTPVVLSLDATPLNYDRVGAAYGHQPRRRPVEQAKRALHGRVFRSATALTTWSAWVRDSLRDDYGVDPDLVTVIAPGVNLDLFPFGAVPRPPAPDGRVRILFVGGDFERKGGPLLLSWLRNSGAAERVELHLVTSAPVEPGPGVIVHRDLGPNDPRLLALYRDADIFALPTLGDCLAVVLGEAMAAGLPVVTTSVGAQPEAVEHGVSGLVVPPNDVQALGRALTTLIDDPAMRTRMGLAGRAVAEARFDAQVNAGRLADLLLQVIDRRRASRSIAALSVGQGSTS